MPVDIISIHALTGSATYSPRTTSIYSPISIHALTGSATSILFSISCSILFQSTHSRGVRQAEDIPSQIPDIFQSTHPRGVRRMCISFGKVDTLFQSTHPRGVRLSILIFIRLCKNFNPRTREWCDVTVNSDNYKVIIISIHAPARGATEQLLPLL